MKHLTAVLTVVLCLFAVPVFAGVPPKTELALAGEFTQTNTEGPNPWALNVSMLFPVGSGHIVLGPAIVIGEDDDLNRLGAGLEWNLAGQKHGGPFIGADAYWFVKSRDEGPQHSVVALAGLKFNVGKGAALKFAAFDVLDGVGQDTTDLGVTAGIIAKF